MIPLHLPGRKAGVRFLERTLPALAWAACVVLCAWIAAELFTRYSRPAVVLASSSHETDPRRAADITTALRPFGTPAATGNDASGDVHYTLVGFATGFGTLPGFALLATPDGRSIAAQVGEQLDDGSTLRHIAADHVVLERKGSTYTLTLPDPGRRPASPVSNVPGSRSP